MARPLRHAVRSWRPCGKWGFRQPFRRRGATTRRTSLSFNNTGRGQERLKPRTPHDFKQDHSIFQGHNPCSKRPSVHYGACPTGPTTPTLPEASPVWMSHWIRGVQGQNWRLMAFSCLLLSGRPAKRTFLAIAHGHHCPWLRSRSPRQAQRVRPGPYRLSPHRAQIAYTCALHLRFRGRAGRRQSFCAELAPGL